MLVLLAGIPITFCGDGDQVRYPLHVGNLVELYLLDSQAGFQDEFIV